MQKVDVSGELTTGSILHLDNVFFTDKDNDLLDLNKMNNTDDIKWYLVDNDAADPSGAPAATGTSFTIPADAGGKKLKSFTELRRRRGPQTAHSCLKLSY